jgi:peptide/nickel transport system permease protein
MTLFVARRAFSALVTLLVMSVVVFVLSRLSGDPRHLLLGEFATAEDFRILGEQLGLDQPLPVQYVTFISRAVMGDLGRSIQAHQPVGEMIAQRFPATLELATVAFGLTLVLSVGLGVATAVRRDTWIDTAGKVIALVGQSVPAFWLGIVLIFVVSLNLGLLPTSGRGDVRYVILPAIALSANVTAAIVRLLRGGMLDALDAEYVKLARVKGVGEAHIAWVHCLRNAALVPLTYAGIVLGHFLTGSIVVETVFGWPGVGLLALQAVQTRDYPLLQGVVLVFAAIYVAVAFVVDLLYSVLDPRVRVG